MTATKTVHLQYSRDSNERSLEPRAPSKASGDRPLRVLHVIHGLQRGGLENGVINLVNRLPTDQFAHSICCLDHRGELADRIVGDIPIHVLDRKRYDLRLPLRLARLLRVATGRPRDPLSLPLGEERSVMHCYPVCWRRPSTVSRDRGLPCQDVIASLLDPNTPSASCTGFWPATSTDRSLVSIDCLDSGKLIRNPPIDLVVGIVARPKAETSNSKIVFGKCSKK